MKLLLLLALLGLAKEPGTPVTIETSGFEVQAMLPRGWSFPAETGLVPPSALVSSCRVRGQFYADRKWEAFLVSALRSSDRYRIADAARTLHKINGHPAVTNRYTRGGWKIRDVYINLADLHENSGAVFTFEGNNTAEAADCEAQFVAIVHGARITRAVD